MLSLARRCRRSLQCLQPVVSQLQPARAFVGSAPPNRRRSKFTPAALRKTDDKSEWWVVDGEMHEIGENVPPRERFVIPRDNIPNKRRKQLREQFMRRTRLVLKESEHEPWCKKYMELYQELRENWERIYWDEGYSKKLGQERASYDSAEDDDDDFSPYRRKQHHHEETKVLQSHNNTVSCICCRQQSANCIKMQRTLIKFLLSAFSCNLRCEPGT
ncbi:uncharacterized protein LOC112512645 isoform X2 [Cynara cardunculus var. scolymus]|uniref:uncharacterized protein LOC112512645 isoform X2 n=1 Tax=Cynara cardunculus var. scolymus TaxID=59895 RepID=UPI000D62C2BF|nr:uncharacterized protein LOC112512645 isoform X2 [Cynara cardunculus var. scolymus]